MDIVFIEGLQIDALIGIYDWERRIRQPLVFDLEMQFDNTIPAASDAIADTLDYKAVSKRIVEYVGQSGFGLVETLAERVAAIVLEEFGVERVRLKLSKPGAVRGARAVGVMIERTRQPGAPRRAQVTPAAVTAPDVLAKPVAATAPELEAAAFAAAVPRGGAAASPAETPAVPAPATVVEASAAIPAAASAVDFAAAAHAPVAEAVSGNATDADAAEATTDNVAAAAAGATPETATTAEASEPSGVADTAGPSEAVEPATAPEGAAAVDAADREDANAPSPLEAALLAAVSGWHSPRPAPSGLDAALSALGEKNGRNGRNGRKQTPASASDAAVDATPAAVESPVLPAAAVAPPTAAEPPALPPVDIEAGAARVAVAEAPAAVPAPIAEPAVAAPAAARANFMRDLDEAPVRPVSVAEAAPDATDDRVHAAPSPAVSEPAAGADEPAPAAAATTPAPAAAEAIAPRPAAPSTERIVPAFRTAPPPPRPRNPASDLGRTTRPAYLSLGSNIEPEKNLRSALMALRARFGEVIVSPVYRMPAVGFDGPEFLNAAAIIDSDLDPFALTRWLHGIESAHGRMRSTVKNSSRTLDMDIIFFDDLVLDMPGGLQLPRPELRHAFVLKPLVDIAPGFIDPVRGVPLAQVWASHAERETKFNTVII